MKLWHVKTRTGIIVFTALIIAWVVFKIILHFIVQVNQLIPGSNQNLESKKAIRLEFLKRQQRAYDTCIKNERGVVEHLYTYNSKHMAYCPVAKVGSTFWKRIMLYLHNDTGGLKVNNPFEIPRLFTHYGIRRSMKRVSFDINSRAFLWNMTRFMFVRNPYSRLWSAYLDKFFLPDFWHTFARNIVSMRNETQSVKTFICNHDVTFKEFLNFVAFYMKDEPEVLNEHWRPIQHMCNPCEFRPHLIGKQETFAQDAKYVLKYFGLKYLLVSYDHKRHVEKELMMLIDYNYKLARNKKIYGCITHQELAHKLWTVFEFNGYLPFGSKSALNGVQNLTSDVFSDIVLKTYRINYKTSHEWKIQRENAMINAYRSVPNNIIKGLQKLFQMDFIHFNYDSNPPGSLQDLR